MPLNGLYTLSILKIIPYQYWKLYLSILKIIPYQYWKLYLINTEIIPVSILKINLINTENIAGDKKWLVSRSRRKIINKKICMNAMQRNAIRATRCRKCGSSALRVKSKESRGAWYFFAGGSTPSENHWSGRKSSSYPYWSCFQTPERAGEHRPLQQLREALTPSW